LQRARRAAAGARVVVAGRTYDDVEELDRLMAESRDPRRLFHAWNGWRRAVGPPCRPLFRRMMAIANDAARAAGKSTH